MPPIFRSGQPEATTLEDIARQLAALDIRALLFSAPAGWVQGDRLRALHHDATTLVEQLDQQKGDAA